MTKPSQSLPTDAQAIGARLYFLPVQTRVPLKFGAETLTSVTCARAAIRVRGVDGCQAEGWGETPLSVQWVWPSSLPYAERHQALCDPPAQRLRACAPGAWSVGWTHWTTPSFRASSQETATRRLCAAGSSATS